MTSILVAGVGNIFCGDDAFGVEVARRLAHAALPDGVQVIDFGIRGIDLTYALMDGYDAVILVDAAQRGETPGVVSVVEPERAEAGAPAPEDLALSPHELDPAKALRLVSALGGSCRRVVLVACEPLYLGGDEGVIGLSEPVAAAVGVATETIEELIDEMIAAQRDSILAPSDVQRSSERGAKS
ncbi:hydrogenase maturation protease [Methylocystis sp. 9N]|uniref:Hydrogenase maturation protease n=1 Tax=Methylocystis borbori TaxID=3118750 RepID=A0ABU7XGX7_9HYPH